MSKVKHVTIYKPRALKLLIYDRGKKLTYKILIDYYSEGFKFHDDKEYATVNEAVKVAVNLCFGNPFHIVSVIDWKASIK